MRNPPMITGVLSTFHSSWSGGAAPLVHPNANDVCWPKEQDMDQLGRPEDESAEGQKMLGGPPS